MCLCVGQNQEVSPLTRTIGPETDCDLCSLGKEKVFSLLPLIIPLSLAARREEKFRMVISLQVRSTQADSRIFRIGISWDGNWEDGDIEIQRHLKVTII